MCAFSSEKAKPHERIELLDTDVHSPKPTATLKCNDIRRRLFSSPLRRSAIDCALFLLPSFIVKAQDRSPGSRPRASVHQTAWLDGIRLWAAFVVFINHTTVLFCNVAAVWAWMMEVMIGGGCHISTLYLKDIFPPYI